MMFVYNMQSVVERVGLFMYDLRL